MDYPSDPAINLYQGKFFDGDPGQGIPASRDPAAHMNAVTDELLAVITAAGLTADEGDLTQLEQAIWTMSASLGAPFMHPGSTPPPGALEAAGVLLSRTTYARLWAHISNPANGFAVVTDAAWSGGQIACYSSGDGATTFRLPDLRGEFIRGWDNGRGIDAGRLLGSGQTDDFKSHNHSSTNGRDGGGIGGYSGYSGGSITPTNPFSASVSTVGGSETRPRNVALMFCIKY